MTIRTPGRFEALLQVARELALALLLAFLTVAAIFGLFALYLALAKASL